MKMIIRNDSDLPDGRALHMVMRVVDGGSISGKHTARGEQHCYYTTFCNGFSVSCRKNKSGSETFTIARIV